MTLEQTLWTLWALVSSSVKGGYRGHQRMQCYSAVSAVPSRDVHVETDESLQALAQGLGARGSQWTPGITSYCQPNPRPSRPSPFPSLPGLLTSFWPQFCASTGLWKGTEHLPKPDGSQTQFTFTSKTAGAQEQPARLDSGTLHTSQTPWGPMGALCAMGTQLWQV